MKPTEYTANNITVLAPNEVFTFGSNTRGRHGAGAAYIAAKLFGAKYGEGVGHFGQSYAIPTKDEKLNVLSLQEIRVYICNFLAYAKLNPSLKFLVTEIGCGLAGYKVEDIAPLFGPLPLPQNVVLPKSFHDHLFASALLNELSEFDRVNKLTNKELALEILEKVTLLNSKEDMLITEAVSRLAPEVMAE